MDQVIPDHREDSPDKIQAIRHIGVRILHCLAHICEEHGLHYFLAYGTLLGAIRHQGFIPWDDDVDIMMTESDFRAFKRHCHKLPSSLKLVRHGNAFWKIMDRYSIISKDQRRGVAVDIFIVKETSDERFWFQNVHNSNVVLLEKEALFPFKKVNFGTENTFPAPADTDTYLKTLYKDYMTPPPPEKRVYPHLGAQLQIGQFKGTPLN
ncbi:MAG: LicD family protein [Bacteroidota bacterium]